jgi:hypothetical protein
MAPPAIATLIEVTTASKIMLQFSSRILIPEKRERGRLVPADRRETRMYCHALWDKNFEMTVSVAAVSGRAFDDVV